MATFSPHHNHHKAINVLQLISSILFWLVLALSILLGIFPNSVDYPPIKQAVDMVNIIAILVFFALEIIAEYVIVPDAEQKRREDFIDNSFGTKFMIKNSIDYYDNEEVKQGLYKAAVNLFENVFFTFSLVKIITLKKIIVPAIALITVWVIAYYGISRVPLALTVLQVIFSVQILGGLVKHLILRSKLHTIQAGIIKLFQNSDLKVNIHQYATDIYNLWLGYESLISRIPPGVPDKVFKKYNVKLTDEWKDLKTRFFIA